MAVPTTPDLSFNPLLVPAKPAPKYGVMIKIGSSRFWINGITGSVISAALYFLPQACSMLATEQVCKAAFDLAVGAMFNATA